MTRGYHWQNKARLTRWAFRKLKSALSCHKGQTFEVCEIFPPHDPTMTQNPVFDGGQVSIRSRAGTGQGSIRPRAGSGPYGFNASEGDEVVVTGETSTEYVDPYDLAAGDNATTITGNGYEMFSAGGIIKVPGKGIYAGLEPTYAPHVQEDSTLQKVKQISEQHQAAGYTVKLIFDRDSNFRNIVRMLVGKDGEFWVRDFCAITEGRSAAGDIEEEIEASVYDTLANMRQGVNNKVTFDAIEPRRSTTTQLSPAAIPRASGGPRRVIIVRVPFHDRGFQIPFE